MNSEIVIEQKQNIKKKEKNSSSTSENKKTNHLVQLTEPALNNSNDSIDKLKEPSFF